KIITVHRIGSANIVTETDLIIAVQQSIMAALEVNGISNQGAASMRDSFLDFLKDEDNKSYFAQKMKREEYARDFADKSVDEVERIINSEDSMASENMMRKVMKVMRDIGQIGILKDADAMSDWIKEIIEKNNLKAIVFAWDEFSEFLLSHPMGLTGFQTLLEISNSHPFYFVIVAHEAERIFADGKTGKKFLDRFQKPVEISLPENTAFKLLASAMKITNDPVLSEEWNSKIKPTINTELYDVRRHILGFERTTGSKKSVFTDEELQAVAPIHPYAALVLRQIASMFNSNQRSMFDFIITNDDDFKGFKYFINNYGPFDKANILTVDMLWDFFCGKQVKGLSDDVRGIFLSYDGLKSESLRLEEQRVLKTILILQAVSARISNDTLLAPSEETLDLAFSGTNWSKGKAKSIAAGLVEKGLVFEKPVANGHKEYCVANGNVGDDIKKYREQAVAEAKTSALIVNADLGNAVDIPACVKMRYNVELTGDSGFAAAINNLTKKEESERFNVIITFALNDVEAAKVKQQITKYVSMPNGETVFIESLVPMGNDLYNQYIESMAFSKYYQQKDKEQARHYQNQAEGFLRQWNQNIAGGAFIFYIPGDNNGVRQANLDDLQTTLRSYDLNKYPRGLEQYSLNATLYAYYNPAQGAELGINQETKGAYRISNTKNSIENALEGAWKVDNYWKNNAKQSLTIVCVKNRIEKFIEKSFENNNGEVSILSLWQEMEKPPYGFMPNAITSFVLGFCLKEYANSNYFWSNHSNTETMTVDKMKQMIGNVVTYRLNGAKNYKEEYIVTMTPSMREFLKGSSAVFGIPEAQCTSIESTRDHVRIKMRGFSFPIWCIKSLLDNESFKSSRESVEKAIDYYTGIANSANIDKETESSLAEKTGKLFIDEPEVITDLQRVITDEKCREGMIAYIGKYKDGELRKLAAEVNDNGRYIDEVRKKFNAADGNWVWSSQTADERISDVILEYKIIRESNKSLSACASLSEVITEWNRRTNNIKMPCEAAAKQVGDLGSLLWQLSSIKRNNTIADKDKQMFYDLLCTQREAFDAFYKDQIPYFKADANSLLSDLSDADISEIYGMIPSGQFTKGKTEYYNFIQQEIEKFVQSQWKKKMQTMWQDKTGSKDPEDWSDTYATPILCMVSDSERSEARKIFAIIKSTNPSEEEAKAAIEFMEKAKFYDKLSDKDERDKRFMETIVGSNAVLLNDVNDIRKKLRAKLSNESPYFWLGSSAVQNCLRSMVDKEYKFKGSEMASQIIDSMDASQLREYLKQRIADDAEFGIQILKGEVGK
ncbi:MAG: hypothetical protein NC452_18810, partial [Eubacterium sp.]|nr:hypothetical protein [Eubacterium sp.]